MTSVVLVTVDSLRADHVGCYGYDRNTTPTLDALAESGISFDAYANANWTRASFPSIITSTYPLEYGGFEYLSENRKTIGSAVQDSDYRTAAFHSNLWLSRDYNYDRGFDHFYDSKSEPSLTARLRTYVKLNLDHDSRLYRALQWAYDTTEEKAGVDVGQTYKDAEALTDRVLEWLTAASPDEFFLWVHYMDVHHPYVPHEEDAEALGLDLDVGEREAIRLRRKMLESPDELTDAEHQTLVDLYDAEIRFTDRHIGRLLDAVETSNDPGLADTAVIVTADHGEEFAEHDGYSHNPSMYDEVLRVPLVLYGADRLTDCDATGWQDEQVELLDVAPTVCDLFGVSVPESYRGRSVLDAAGSDEHARVISETVRGDDFKFSIRTSDWKYIWDRDVETVELYDLGADSGETMNIAYEYPEVAAEFEDEVRSHIADLRETNETLPSVRMDSETEGRLRNLGYLE